MQRSSSIVQAGVRNDNLYVVEPGSGDYLESLVQENDVEYMRELVWPMYTSGYDAPGAWYTNSWPLDGGMGSFGWTSS